MKKILVLFISLIFCMASAVGVYAKKSNSAKTLPPIVAQFCGQANTVIMWHDINNDGLADSKATYVFKDGQLHRLNEIPASQDELRYLIRER